MTDIEELLARINEIRGCEQTKRRVVELLRSMAGRRLRLRRRVLLLPVRIGLASNLLDAHMPTNEARDALCERLNVSRRTAQRLVREARAVRADRAMLRQLSIEWPG